VSEDRDQPPPEQNPEPLPPDAPAQPTRDWFPVQPGYILPLSAPAGPPPRKSRTGLVIAGLIGLVGVAGLTLGVITYTNGEPKPADAASSGGTVTQAAMCQTIATASAGDGPSAIPTMPGGQQDLTAMQAAEVQVYQWAADTEAGTLKTELVQENSDAQRFITDYDANPEQDSITPTGVLSIDMSTFTIDQTKVDSTCGISTKGTGGLSA
jgi:hypothetical protein